MARAHVQTREFIASRLHSFITSPEVLRLVHDITTCSVEWLDRPDLEALVSLWGRDWDAKLAALAAWPKHITLRLLPVREEDYAAAADDWWSRAVQSLKVRDLAGRPVYLVTSNTHALRNLVSGFTTAHEPAISGHAACWAGVAAANFEQNHFCDSG